MFHKKKRNKGGLNYQCKECVSLYGKKRYPQITERRKLYVADRHNKDRRNIIRREKYKVDPSYRMKECVSSLVYNYMKRAGGKKDGRSVDNMPWSVDQLWDYLEPLMTPEMTRENYGSYWELDHIVPQSKLLYDSYEHPNFKKCWSLENLQPLTVSDNKSKRDRDMNEWESRRYL